MAERALQRLLELRDDPYKAARLWKESTGGKVLGHFCSYVPEEMVYAAGMLPVRITGENRALTMSDAHLQSYCCSLARTSLDMALEGDLDFLDGTVFEHTCDTMQRLSDIWRRNCGFEFHADVILPVKMEGEYARRYMERELEAFRGKLEQYSGVSLDEGRLREALELCKENRKLLREIYDLRRSRPQAISYPEALWAVHSSTLMPKSEHTGLLRELISEVKEGGEGEAAGPRVFLTGSVFDQWELLDRLENLGAEVVDDDLCNGYRYIERGAALREDPMSAIADRLMGRVLCPCKYAGSRPRLSYFMDRVKSSGADGVIFFLYKFCEPHAFDYPHLKNALDRTGIPSLLLEVEQGSVSVGGMTTRLEAFLEMLSEE